VPLDRIDLEARPYVPRSGWPIGWEELSAYYPRAQDYCDAGPWAYGVAEALGPDAPPTIQGFRDPDIEAELLERFSRPTDFGRAYGGRLARSARTRVLLRAQALRLLEDGVVTGLEAAVTDLPQRRFTLRARNYVLASGGLETPRLLMVSDRSRRGGLGNAGGALGRYYMCHLENTLGQLQLMPADRPIALEFERTADGTYVRRKLAVSAVAQRREQLLNTTFRLHHALFPDPSHRSGVLSAMYLVKDAILPEYSRKLTALEHANRAGLVRNRQFWLAHLGNVARDSLEVGRFGLDWLRRRTFAARKLPFVVVRSRQGSYPLDFNAEQVPNPDSRVALAADTDAHGVPRLMVDWRLARQDVDSLLRAAQLVRDAFARSGTARFEFDAARLEAECRASAPVGGHHLGTARMSASPAEGVVDANCAVHGVPNLYVASGAVFPTCGHANPTLTIVALAIRLADHLKARMASPPAAQAVSSHRQENALDALPLARP
jgi:choline dehydrogenase-like flavoprotein